MPHKAAWSFRKLINRNIIIESAVIVMCAIVAGLCANFLRSQGVSITSRRPVTVEVADSIFFQEATRDKADVLSQPVVIRKIQLIRLLQRKTVVLLDARTPEEYTTGHIPGALNVPAEELYQYENVLNQIPRDQWIICYCDGPPCDLGELLASQLFTMGYPRVAFYLDGLNDWKKTEKIALE
jgi:rhodanese-related sulfurtransferase